MGTEIVTPFFILNLFMQGGRLRIKSSQLILFTLDRLFHIESILFLTRFERREKPDLSLYAES